MLGGIIMAQQSALSNLGGLQQGRADFGLSGALNARMCGDIGVGALENMRNSNTKRMSQGGLTKPNLTLTEELQADVDKWLPKL